MDKWRGQKEKEEERGGGGGKKKAEDSLSNSISVRCYLIEHKNRASGLFRSIFDFIEI